MPPIVRFAPSPTGRLHIGNLRPALLNWLFAARHGGTFILRLDDTDRIRSTEAFATAIREDLAWIGLSWAREERQSTRLARYAEAAERLKAAGRLYPCYESEDELDRRRKRQLARGLPPIYDRAALSLSPEDRRRLEDEGRRPHWRFLLANFERDPKRPGPTLEAWSDLVRGEQQIGISSLSDPVLVREDGTPLYTFSSVVDDIDFGITHVIRGEDHVTNTGIQIQIFKALGAGLTLPRFAHHSLLVGADGQALSKRIGSLSIEGFRAAGIEPMAIASLAALIGTPEAIAPFPTLPELAQHFDLERLSRSPGRFDEAELRSLNAKLLHATAFERVCQRLQAWGIDGGEAFWNAVRGNIVTLDECRDWWQVVSGPIAPRRENEPLLAEAAALLPAEPWDATTFGAWTEAIKARTNAKGRALFHPLRLALTGRETGPELKALLPLIGRERALTRLVGQTG